MWFKSNSAARSWNWKAQTDRINQSITSTERRYSQIEREALGCVLAVEHLHDYLFGLEFTLITDNKPLSTILNLHKVYHRVFSA